MGNFNPFPNRPIGVHWYGLDLYDDEYKVGTIRPTFGQWVAHPYWNEEEQEFNSEEEASAWLLTMYKMGGANAIEPKTRRRPAAK